MSRDRAEWKIVCQLVWLRAGTKCERCGRPHRKQPPHHRRFRSHGGPDVPSNLAALCLACHNWCHQGPRAEAETQGWVVPSWQDWRDTPVTLYGGQKVMLDDAGSYTRAGGRA